MNCSSEKSGIWRYSCPGHLSQQDTEAFFVVFSGAVRQFGMPKCWLRTMGVSSSAEECAQVIEDRRLIHRASRETNIAIRADQDLRITADAIKAVGVSIHIDYYVLASSGCGTGVNDRVRCHERIVDIG